MENLMTTKELLEWLNISSATANTWRRDGMPYHQKNKRVIRYDKKEVAKWLSDNNIKVKTTITINESQEEEVNNGYEKVNEAFEMIIPLLEVCRPNSEKEFLEYCFGNEDIGDKDFVINSLVNKLQALIAEDTRLRHNSILLSRICLNFWSNVMKKRNNYDFLDKSVEELQDDLDDTFCKLQNFSYKLMMILGEAPSAISVEDINEVDLKIEDLKEFIKEK